MSYISKIGIIIFICLSLFQAVSADVEIGVGNVYFVDSNIILTDGQVFTNITAYPSEIMIYDSGYFINLSATADTQIIALNRETEGTDTWVFDAATTSGVLSITIESETGRLYEMLIDSVLKDTKTGNGRVTFTYNEWSTHSFIIRASAAAANIYDWLNSASNNKMLKPMVSEGEIVDFDLVGYTADGTITFHWFENGEAQINNNPRYTTSWPRWGDTAEVTCYISDNNGNSANLTWEPYIVVARATSTAIPVDPARSNEFVNATDDMDLETMLAAEMYMYTDTMGVFFYLFIIGIPMTMMYIRTGSLKVPGAIGIISGSFMIGALPAAYQTPAVILIVISIAAIMLTLFKERSG